MSIFPFERYLNVRSAGAPDFSPDGRFLCFVSDITGVPQLWRVPMEGGWPDQLTFTADRVTTGHAAHHSDFIVYGMDTGGNEREGLYLLAGGEDRALAVDPDVIHTFGAISPDDSQLAYADNRRQPAYFDVYLQHLGSGEERCVYQQDGSNTVADWSSDGRFLLIHRQTGSLDSELYLLDLESGDVRHLTPHDGLAQYNGARFSPDGRIIWVCTDQDSEFLRAARLDVAGATLDFVTEDTEDVTECVPSPDGKLIALLRNLQGWSQLVVRTVGADDEVVAPLPPSVLGRPVWAPTGDATLAFTLTAPNLNPNVWTWRVGSNGDARQVTHASLGGLPPEAFVIPEQVSFPSFDGLSVPAFLYTPQGIQRPPVVMNVHGGPESQATPMFSPVTQYLVNRGYAVLTPNVRGSTGYGRTYTHLDDVEKRMDSVADLRAAAEWLRGSERVDGEKIAIYGGSYGGFMVLAALTTYPDLWAAGVDIVGIANFDTFLRNTGAYRRAWRIPEYGDPDRDAELFERISPIHRIHEIEAPLIVIHGDNDPRVPLGEAEQIVAAMERRGRPVEFLHFPDEGHGVIKLKNKLVAYPAIAAFLDRYLARSS